MGRIWGIIDIYTKGNPRREPTMTRRKRLVEPNLTLVKTDSEYPTLQFWVKRLCTLHNTGRFDLLKSLLSDKSHLLYIDDAFYARICEELAKQSFDGSSHVLCFNLLRYPMSYN